MHGRCMEKWRREKETCPICRGPMLWYELEMGTQVARSEEVSRRSRASSDRSVGGGEGKRGAKRRADKALF